MTDTQWLWLQCQWLLDDGAQACPSCDALGTGAYCATCGTRLQPEESLCPDCHLPGTGAYCHHCGAAMGSHLAEAIEAGTFDWAAWRKSLTPFLGGLTPQEQQLLMQG